MSFNARFLLVENMLNRSFDLFN